jgi:hypothetical protein
VGVKLAITGAMQFATLVANPQLGAAGITGFVKFGFVPKILLGAGANDPDVCIYT